MKVIQILAFFMCSFLVAHSFLTACPVPHDGTCMVEEQFIDSDSLQDPRLENPFEED